MKRQDALLLLALFGIPAGALAQARGAPVNGEGVWQLIQDILTLQLFLVENQPVTPLKILLSLLILALGMYAVRRLAHEVRRVLTKRARLPADAALFFERIIQYACYVLVTLLALDFVGIPLKIFAFLGGAVAIAVGFGAQEILGNFLSGLILMTERPIRIGDLVEINGQQGKVEDIGARCTRLLMPGNFHLLVPNKSLLESHIINWTYADELVRSDVGIGVTYGSPTRKVCEVLRQAATEHPHVDHAREPIVLFSEFGDSSLDFTIHFWTRVRDFMDRSRIESEVRLRIDELFAEHGITMPFPQRDVHLDTLKPLEVRVVEKGVG